MKFSSKQAHHAMISAVCYDGLSADDVSLSDTYQDGRARDRVSLQPGG